MAGLIAPALAISLIAGCSTVSSNRSSSSHANSTERTGGPEGGPRVSKHSAQSKSELTIPDHPAIDAWTIHYAEKKHQSFQTLLRRAEAYVIPVQKIFSDQGVPGDLAYVALVESGFTPTARSKADAVGMWQFISATGTRFGLEQNKYVDERRHPFKAAHAAAAYLSALFDQFGSWELALAAYNSGENRVQRTLDESGAKTFWELREAGWLPAETQEYVPKVLAAVRISRSLPQYGFYFSPRPDPPRHDTVPVPGGVKLAWIGKKIGVEEAVLQEHNPELCTPSTPPGSPCYDLSVPMGMKESVLAALLEPPPAPEKPAPAPSRNQRPDRSVKSRPSMAKTDLPKPLKASEKSRPAAQASSLKQEKPPAALKAAPGIKSGDASKERKDARPSRNDTTALIASAATRKAEAARPPAQKSPKTFWYAIRQGDTLPSVAQRFGVTVEALATGNQLSRNQKLVPGKVITICTEERAAGRSEKRQAN
jgi:membrane-bound lytic murein transglycosylase D